MSFSRRAIYLIFFILAVALFNTSPAAENKQPRLVRYDALGSPGEKVFLRAALMGEGGFLAKKALSGERLYFKWREELIGVARTDDDGVAAVVYEIPEDQRVMELDVIFEGSGEYAPARAELRLYVIKKNRPVFVCNATELLFDLSPDEFMNSDPDDVDPADGLPISLQALHQKRGVVYITRRDADYAEKLHSWMRVNVIPPGPIFNPELGISPLFEKSSEKEFFSELKKRYPRLESGITHDKGDLRLFLAQDLRAVIVNDKVSRDSLPEGAVKASGWKEVYEILR